MRRTHARHGGEPSLRRVAAGSAFDCADWIRSADWAGLRLVTSNRSRKTFAIKRALLRRARRARARRRADRQQQLRAYRSRASPRAWRRARACSAHYFMPAHLVPLVEIVLGADSDPALAQALCAQLTAIGKKPVLVKRDIAGFLANRIQHAMMREVLLADRQRHRLPRRHRYRRALQLRLSLRRDRAGGCRRRSPAGDSTSRGDARDLSDLVEHARGAGLPGLTRRRRPARPVGGAGFFRWPARRAAAAARGLRSAGAAARAARSEHSPGARRPASPPPGRPGRAVPSPGARRF